MPLRLGGGGGGRGLRRVVPSSHERSESRLKIILHPDSLRGKGYLNSILPAEGI